MLKQFLEFWILIYEISQANFELTKQGIIKAFSNIFFVSWMLFVFVLVLIILAIYF